MGIFSKAIFEYDFEHRRLAIMPIWHLLDLKQDDRDTMCGGSF
jgi:hypothetical protein